MSHLSNVVFFFTLNVFAASPEAVRITKQALLVDGHNDLPWTLRENNDMQLTKYDLNKNQSKFHTDIPRLKSGGLGAQFWSAYVPVILLGDKAVKATYEQIDLIHRMVDKYSESFEFAKTAADVERIYAAGKIASLIGVEGGHSINNSIDTLQDFYNKGVRYMTLTHSKNTDWADSCTDTPKSNGLSDFGKKIVKEMNRMGMFIDLSHVTPKTMKDAIEVSKAPVIFSHSSAWAIREHVRNVPDDVLKMLKSNGGVVMVNFYTSFVCNLGKPCNVKTVVDHIDHIVKVAGIDHVGIGSDFDGVPTLPDGLKDVGDYPNITQELMNRNYDEASIKKILGGNLVRAMHAMEAASGR